MKRDRHLSNRPVRFALAVFVLLGLSACQNSAMGESLSYPGPSTALEIPKGMGSATFAGGCFWCMEAPFDHLPGVISTTSGYTDGAVVNPTYEAVAKGLTGHTEAIRIVYDPAKISYARLLEVFWRNIDPMAKDRQFCDRGTQYRSGIYFHDATQEKAARDSLRRLVESGALKGTVFTELKAVSAFYPAEAYHQDFYRKNPSRYTMYRMGCGRDARLAEIWGKSDAHK